MKSGKNTLLLVCFGIALSLFSCEEEQCAQIYTSRVQAKFYLRDTLGSEVASQVPVFTMYGLGNDDTLYNRTTAVEIFTMPLSPDYNERSFVLSNDSINDTLTFTYTSRLQLINTVCGFVPNYTISKVENTTNFIQGINISNEDVNTDDKENIKIYLR